MKSEQPKGPESGPCNSNKYFYYIFELKKHYYSGIKDA